jgi:hypothetical protein
MDMRHTIRGDTQDIIARTITSFTINHTPPMSAAIILRITPMAFTIARTMATLITIAPVMATDERTIAHTCGVMAPARTGDSDGQASFKGAWTGHPAPGQRMSPELSRTEIRQRLGARAHTRACRVCGSTRGPTQGVACQVSTSIAGWRARR